jgi:hypothetical protein
MPTPFWTRLVIGLAAALWLGVALALKAPVDASWLKPAGVVMSAVVLLLLGFDRWAWRWLPTSVMKRPKLHGTWKATLEWKADDGDGIESKPCFLVVRQTFSTVTVDLLTEVASSQSRSAAIREDNGRCSLWFSYWAAAGALHRDGNAPHRGAAQLVIATKPRTRLEGDYWTERQTRGRIVADAHTAHVYEDYVGAVQGEYR